MTATPEPVPARAAATVLLLGDNPLRVLMIERHAAQFFGSALVFPGGGVDADDASEDWLPHLSGHGDLAEQERALRIAACREVFEETGILLVEDAQDFDVAPAGEGETFRDLIRRNGARLALDALERFGHWITPVIAPKRFDTHFFIARAPAGQMGRCDGNEAVRLEWLTPAEVFAYAEQGGSLPLPTRMHLHRIAESETAEQVLAAARMRPLVSVMPHIEKVDERYRISIPVEAGYAVSEFWQDRLMP